MSQPTFGVPVSIDAPPPSPPALTLVGAATIRAVTDDRWMNGGALWPYGYDLPDTFDPCQALSSAGHAKNAGTPVGEQLFGAFTVLEGITCTTRSGIATNSTEWMARVEAVLEAREHWGIENEFWTGALKPLNPHLAQPLGYDGNAIKEPNGTTATSLKNAVALLEQAIADAGGDGVIHMRSGAFAQTTWESNHTPWTINQGVARTSLGTPVVPGVGYAGSAPDGTAPATTIEWIYATGPVELRRSEIFILPGSVSQATDRAQNTTTFRAERHVLVTWDQRIHAAVKIDRSYTTFTS